jgi:cell pole-organizing protein PopZ
MEQILASIRRMISEGDEQVGEPKEPEPPVAESGRTAGNVAELFGDDFADEDDEPLTELDDEPPPETGEATDSVVELAIAQAMEDAEAELRADAEAAAMTPPPVEEPPMPSPPTSASSPAAVPAPTPPAPPPATPSSSANPPQPVANTPAAAGASREPPATENPRPALPGDRRGAPLLSPRSDAAVSGAFNQLATTMLLSGSARTLDDLVEDLLRPMLRNWLDINLPPLVERLVREEIERVARGRR